MIRRWLLCWLFAGLKEETEILMLQLEAFNASIANLTAVVDAAAAKLRQPAPTAPSPDPADQAAIDGAVTTLNTLADSLKSAIG